MVDLSFTNFHMAKVDQFRLTFTVLTVIISRERLIAMYKELNDSEPKQGLVKQLKKKLYTCFLPFQA